MLVDSERVKPQAKELIGGMIYMQPAESGSSAVADRWSERGTAARLDHSLPLGLAYGPAVAANFRLGLLLVGDLAPGGGWRQALRGAEESLASQRGRHIVVLNHVPDSPCVPSPLSRCAHDHHQLREGPHAAQPGCGRPPPLSPAGARHPPRQRPRGADTRGCRPGCGHHTERGGPES